MFIEMSLKYIQITLDGTSDIYNATKHYVNPSHNFNLVLDNIQKLVDNKIRPSIRINTTDDNTDDVMNLIDILYNRFGNTISVYCSHLFYLDSKFDNKKSISNEK